LLPSNGSGSFLTCMAIRFGYVPLSGLKAGAGAKSGNGVGSTAGPLHFVLVRRLLKSPSRSNQYTARHFFRMRGYLRTVAPPLNVVAISGLASDCTTLTRGLSAAGTSGCLDPDHAPVRKCMPILDCCRQGVRILCNDSAKLLTSRRLA
jgi:hypothetical protein